MEYGKNETIAILLATYNGERYIKDQIDSLLNQSFNGFTIYVHDDGSKDKTMTIVNEYAKRHDNIEILHYDNDGGAKDNFLNMMQIVDADYYMFCDQDDIWALNKVEIQIKKMKEIELLYPNRPIVICSDLYVVDDDLNIIAKSYWEHAGIYPSLIKEFCDFAASSVTTGCTMIYNNCAKCHTIFPANKAIMHDAWVTLCTIKAGGILFCIKEKLVYYRQHGDNCVGATTVSANDFTLSYRLHHLKQFYVQNKEHYNMLKALGYGSLFKYIKYKIIYKKRIRCQKYH